MPYAGCVYIDPSWKYFGPSHAGYAILLSFTVLLVASGHHFIPLSMPYVSRNVFMSGH